MNIHPALLPSFPGEDAQGQAFDYSYQVKLSDPDDNEKHPAIVARTLDFYRPSKGT
jgi:hypothetical protein